VVDVGRPSWGRQRTGEVFSTRDYITFYAAWQEEEGRRGQGQTRGHRNSQKDTKPGAACRFR